MTNVICATPSLFVKLASFLFRKDVLFPQNRFCSTMCSSKAVSFTFSLRYVGFPYRAVISKEHLVNRERGL